MELFGLPQKSSMLFYIPFSRPSLVQQYCYYVQSEEKSRECRSRVDWLAGLTTSFCEGIKNATPQAKQPMGRQTAVTCRRKGSIKNALR